MFLSINFLFLFVLVFNIKIYAQQICGRFSEHLSSSPNKIYLSIQKKNQLIVIDSSTVENRLFCFQKKIYPKGFYYLTINDTNFLEIILNPLEETIKLLFISNKLSNNVIIEQSLENQLLQKGKNLSIKYQEELKKDLSFLNNIPANDTLMRKIAEENIRLKEKKFNDDMYSIINQHPTTFFSESSKLYKQLKSIYPNKKQGKHELIKNLPLGKAEYLNTTLYQQAILNIFKNHTNFSEEDFKKTIDTLLVVAQPYTEEYNLILEMLTDLFYRVGPDVILDYLVENYYLKNSCAENTSTNFIDLIKEYEKIQPGYPLEDFKLELTDSTTNLSNVIKKEDKPVVLFFYSSHCSFCHQSIEQLNTQKDLLKLYSFIFISLDEDKQEWKDFNSNLPPQAYVSCDFKGWQSPIVKRLKIHKTPTLLIINQEMKIMAKGHDLKILTQNK